MSTVVDRVAGTFVAAGAIFIIAGGIVAAVQSAASFEHGVWLAAFLVLVGAGRLAIRARAPSRRVWRAQLLLWNGGTVVVPAGVLAGAPALVTAGSAVLEPKVRSPSVPS